MIWEVFRQEKRGGYHTHCGNVHAPDREMALLFAQIQHGRRKPTTSMWVVPQDEISEVDADETSFGGTTDKSYRWVAGYGHTRPPEETKADDAAEVVESAVEQEEAEQARKEIENDA